MRQLVKRPATDYYPRMFPLRDFASLIRCRTTDHTEERAPCKSEDETDLLTRVRSRADSWVQKRSRPAGAPLSS